MGYTKQADIRLVVNDEQTLYTTFSPEDEFNESVKSYIRSKIADKTTNKTINLIAILFDFLYVTLKSLASAPETVIFGVIFFPL